MGMEAIKYLFGFELEGFYYAEYGGVELPPVKWPTDGFPGLLEVKSTPNKSLYLGLCDLVEQLQKYPGFNYWKSAENTFSPEQRRQLRRRPHQKTEVDIQNLYGKKPRALGNRTLASLQLSFSLPKTTYKGGQNFEHYGVVDFVPLVRALDTEFKQEILGAGRQPGWYAVKGDRVEYRSLPCTVFSGELLPLAERFKKCFYF